MAADSLFPLYIHN